MLTQFLKSLGNSVSRVKITIHVINDDKMAYMLLLMAKSDANVDQRSKHRE